MTYRCSLFLLLASLPFIAACGSYDVTLNDRVIYSPEPLFADYEVPDKALHECIREAINDQRASSASEVTSISCVEAGIESLAGLSTFSQVEQLTLSSNHIADISELAALTVLQVAYLDNNDIVDPVPLYDLPALRLVDLSSNPELLCPASGSLLRVAEVTLPRHCR